MLRGLGTLGCLGGLVCPCSSHTGLISKQSISQFRATGDCIPALHYESDAAYEAKPSKKKTSPEVSRLLYVASPNVQNLSIVPLHRLRRHEGQED